MTKQKKGTEVIPSFQWRDKQGNFHHPSDMETRHLFFTIRMIWNHTCPKECMLEPCIKYTFRPFYSSKYMSKAIKYIYIELMTRDDMKPYFKQQLGRMRAMADDLDVVLELEK